MMSEKIPIDLSDTNNSKSDRPRRIYDRHHVLFRRKSWNAEEETNQLRGDSSLIIKMHNEIHKELHADIDLLDGVPCISREMARRVLSNYTPIKGDPIKCIDNLLQSIDSETKNKSSYSKSWIEVGKAACYAIEVQRPYVNLGNKNNIKKYIL